MKGDRRRCRSWKPSSMVVSPSSWGGAGGHQLLKFAVSLAMVALLFSIYQSFSSRDSLLPVWLSLSLVSRPSFLLASPELTPPERPFTVFISPPALSPLDDRQRPSSPQEDISDFSSVVDNVSETFDKSDDFVGQDENSSSPQVGNSNGKDNRNESVVSSQGATAVQDGSLSPSQVLKSSESSIPTENESALITPATSQSVEGASGVTEATIRRDEQVVENGANSGDQTEEREKNENTAINWIQGQQQRGEITVTFDNMLNDGDKFWPPGPAPSASPVLDLPQAPPIYTRAYPPQVLEKWIGKHVNLEQELLAAKQAIQGATPIDDDVDLYPGLYHNISAFSKSYKLMEEIFRIYVYQEGDERLVHTGPLLGIYASEGYFIKLLKQGSPFFEQDPEKAHMFFLPYSVAEMTIIIYVEGSHSMQPLNTFIKDYVNEVAAKYPFWNRTKGADHFFVSCHDWGPATARDHEELRTNAVKVVCNADVKEEYVIGKDASLPEIYLHSPKPAKMGGPGPGRRQFLAFFAGQMHGHVRPVLIEFWKDKDPEMKIYEVLPKNIERKMNYAQHMKNSKFCICAAGFEVNSPRIVESIYYDCVPVIIADNFVLPFSDVLNWNTFSITIPESEIPNLKSILLSISVKRYRSMQSRLSKVRQHFVWHDHPVKYDVFHMILHSVWMSRLNNLHL